MGLRTPVVYLHFFGCTAWIIGELFNDREIGKKFKIDLIT